MRAARGAVISDHPHNAALCAPVPKNVTAKPASTAWRHKRFSTGNDHRAPRRRRLGRPTGRHLEIAR
jgi:hypothetical protein